MEHPQSSTCHLCAIRDDPSVTPFARLLKDRNPQSQILARDPHCLTIIDVAPIGPGHCIIVPARHQLSLAQTSPDEKSAILAAMSAVGSAISTVFAHEPVFFEHGQCVEGRGLTGCGISHAHLHVVARPEGAPVHKIGEVVMDPIVGGIGALERYRSEVGYLFVEDSLGNAYAARPSGPVSGLLRSHFAWPGYLSGAARAGWSWSDHVAFDSLVGTATRVEANLDALTGRRAPDA